MERTMRWQGQFCLSVYCSPRSGTFCTQIATSVLGCAKWRLTFCEGMSPPLCSHEVLCPSLNFESFAAQWSRKRNAAWNAAAAACNAREALRSQRSSFVHICVEKTARAACAPARSSATCRCVCGIGIIAFKNRSSRASLELSKSKLEIPVLQR